ELIAFGASNIFGGAFKSLAASTALSRSAVQESTGGKTQVAGLLSAIIVLIVTLAIGFLLEPLPKSVLGAVVIVNLKGMLMQVCEVPYLWRKDRPDCVVWVVTCVASILLGLDLGLAVGLGVEMIAVVFRTQFPHCCVLANISGTDIYRNRKDYVNIYEPEGVKIFRIPSPIFFANIDFFRSKLIDAVGFSPLRVLRKRNKALRKIKKLIKNGELTVTNNGLHATCSLPIEESEDENNMEDLDQPVDFSGLPIQVNWRAELPANISVPPVDIHSLVLDFSAVSFLDISALKGLKTALKEFIRIDVEVYIVACDPYIIEKLKSCKFFDDEITTSIFFLTLHDAMLHILNVHTPLSISEKLAMGLLQIGFIAIYLSDTLVSGFTTAAAIHILVSQLKFVLGLNVPVKSGAFSIFFNLVETFRQITSTNLHDLVTSIVVMVVGFIVKEVNKRFKKNLPLPIPIEVMMTIIACGISYAYNFRDNYGVDVVGKIPDRFEPPLALNFIILKETALDAFIMSIVGFTVAFAVAKVYAVKHDYVIDGNQELIAFGASNIFGGAFKSLAASAAFSRSAVQESTGGKTQVAGLLSALIVLIVTLALGFLLEPLPKSVLGAVVIVNLKGMLMQVCEVPYLWRKDRPDCVVWVVTCVASILLGLDLGLAVGLGVEMIAVVFRTQFPHCCVLANISGTDIYRNRKDYVNALKEFIRIDVEVYIVACDRPFPVLSLMVGSVVERFVPDEGDPLNIPGFEGLTMEQQRVIVASSITFLMGVFQLAMGILQIGFIVIYLSDTLVSGFTTAAAVHILVSQLKFVLGLNVPGKSGAFNIFFTLEKVFTQLYMTNMADLLTSIIIMVVVYIVKELNDKFKLPVPIPIEIIMTIIACGCSYGFNFETRFNVTVIGEMVDGFEAPFAPNTEVMKQTVVDAFPIAIVGFAVAFSVAKVYSVKHDYVINGNQELIAFGASNIFGATFRSFAASTALSRTAVQESTGGKTQIAGLISAIIVLIVTVGIGFLLEPLPRSVLGALVIVNLKGMLMQFREVPSIWKKDKADFVTWVATCAASIILSLDLGLAVGLGVELLTVVFRTQFPRCSVLANITGTDLYRDRKDYTSIYEPHGVKIFRIPSPLFFANIEFFRDKVTQAVGFSPLRVLRKRNKALRIIRKMIKNGELHISPRGFELIGCSTNEMSEDESNMESLDQPIDFSDLPIQVNWKAELPANITVPQVNIHSLILDFSAVSFLDLSALKGLKMVICLAKYLPVI
ncbi:hypothetical protein KOW79_016227, partial [Hemibagrus wyckioides]